MATVSDELVERVAIVSARVVLGSFYWSSLTDAAKDGWREQARAAIKALSAPEFVLPLAEEMLREADTYDVTLMRTRPLAVALCNMHGDKIAYSGTLLDAYRAAKGE